LKDKTPHIGDAKNHPVDNSGGDKPDPHATNSVIDGYVPPGGSGAMGKFTMPDSWTPDPDFTKRAALWGVNLKTDVTPFELADFITYWKAEGKAFHHDQWQQKLARSVQLSRTKPARTQQRDVNAVPEPDSEIPTGFRG
ncbi:TPA_asm: Pyocin large subunit, partial [Salmonella enterica subsp. enterica serovar Heidelberg]|nr:Pyocin large subunit [Salmonella enterica subsp. enterica serovar Heidelberg]